MVQPITNEKVEEIPPPVPEIIEDLFDKGIKNGENLEQLLENYSCAELESLKETFENFKKDKEHPTENVSILNDIKESFKTVATKINAYFEGGWTRKDYIVFFMILGIIVAVIVGTVIALNNGNDAMEELNAAFENVNIKSLETTGIDFKKFGNDAKEAFVEADVELKKFGNEVEKSSKTINQELMNLGNEAMEAFKAAFVNDNVISLYTANIELKRLGNDIKEAFVEASGELKKFGNEVEKSSDTINEELMNLGNEAMEAFNAAFANDKIKSLDTAKVELKKFRNEVEEAFHTVNEEFMNLGNEAMEAFNAAFVNEPCVCDKEPFVYDKESEEPKSFDKDDMEAFITGSLKIHLFGDEAINTLNLVCGKIENFDCNDIKAFEAASVELEFKLKIKFE